ncbi:MAG: hypothetical protein GXO78_12225 [Calditrichaeota bacterium]|nr:hypothetical protein [Calditrichota bacterium]
MIGRMLWMAGLIALVIGFTGCGKKNDVVAKVDRMIITVDEFRQAIHERYKMRDVKNVSMDLRKKLLNELIDQRLLALKAMELGLDQDPKFALNVQRHEERLLARKLYENEVMDYVIPDDLFEDYLEWSQYDVTAQILLVGFKGAAAYRGTRTRDEAKKLARELRDRLENGEDFSELAKQYSDDLRTKQRDGMLKPYRIGNLGVEADRAVYTAKEGQLLGPIKTRRGFAIFKVIKKTRLSSGNGMANDPVNLKRRLVSTYFMEDANKRFQEFSQELHERYHARLYEDNMKYFQELIQDWDKQEPKKDSDFTEKQRAIVLAEFDGRTITVGTIIDQYDGKFHENYHRFRSFDFIKKLVDNRMNFDIWVKEARRRGYDRREDIRREMERYRVRQLVALLNREYIRKKAAVSEEEIRQYYERNKSKYMEPTRIEIWVTSFKDEKEALQVARRAVRGADFKKLAETYNVREDFKRRKGYLGMQSTNSVFSAIVERAFKAGPDQIEGPFKSGQYYYVIKTGRLESQKVKPLERVRLFVKSDLERQKQKNVKDSLLKELRREHLFRVNESLLRRMA